MTKLPLKLRASPWLRPLAIALSWAAPSLAIVAPSHAMAGEFHVGVSLGVGSGGVSTYATNAIYYNPTLVNRTEGPGVVSGFVEWTLGDRLMMSIEHMRFISLSPLTSGFSNTSLVVRWYPFAPSLTLDSQAVTENHIFLTGWTPFVGLTGGYAQASISRSNDAFPEVQGNAISVGARLGVDTLITPGLGFRPELIYSLSNSNSVLAAFAVQVGIYTSLF